MYYQNTSLIPPKTKLLLEFHENRKRYGIKFLLALAKEQQLDFIILLRVSNRRWKKLAYDLLNKNKDAKLKLTIEVFNNSTKAYYFAFPAILFKDYINEEYERINSVMKSKVLEAMKKSMKK